MHHKHNKSLAKAVGHGIANTVTQKDEEAQLQAKAAAYSIQEVANAMQQQQDKKFEQMMQLFQTMLQVQGNGYKVQGNGNKVQGNDNNGNNNGNPSNAPNDQKQQHPKCKHCNRRHKKDASECWELEANKDKHPKGYKTKAKKAMQDSWCCKEARSAEQWQPGKVEIDKMAKDFPYLVTPGPLPPHNTTLPPAASLSWLIVVSKPAQKWKRQIA